jgi:hypothetical protein
MRIQVLMTMLAAGTSLWAAAMPDRSVTICEEGGPATWSTTPARAEASKIFAQIGVRLEWRIGTKECAINEDAIAIHMSYDTPKTKLPNAFACASPYGERNIVVFYDRIKNEARNTGTPHLLAYVFVHEIAHVVQGVARHSQSGIMKAGWEADDFFEMGNGRLHFTDEDVSLLYLGLDWHRTLLAGGDQHPGVIQ